MDLDLSPQQQTIVNDAGAAQDALHGALASLHAGERQFVIAGGPLYKIGAEPEAGQRFGLGFGGQHWTIIWPDGSETHTRNLWHWDDVDRPDTGLLMQAPFWGNNLRSADREHLLQPTPLNLRARYTHAVFPNGFYGILEEREATHVQMARERTERNARYDANPLLQLTKHRGGAWRHVVLTKRLAAFVRSFINSKLICLSCGHRPSLHWEIGDEMSGPVDWGCGAHHVDRRTGKHVHCNC